MINLEEYTVVTENSRDYLNQRQLVDYRSEREECFRWLLAYGKDPKKAEGYAPGTVMQCRSTRREESTYCPTAPVGT